MARGFWTTLAAVAMVLAFTNSALAQTNRERIESLFGGGSPMPPQASMASQPVMPQAARDYSGYIGRDTFYARNGCDDMQYRTPACMRADKTHSYIVSNNCQGWFTNANRVIRSPTEDSLIRSRCASMYDKDAALTEQAASGAIAGTGKGSVVGF